MCPRPGYKQTEEHKRKLNSAQYLKPWPKGTPRGPGRIMSIDTRKRMSLAQKKRVIEGRNHLWKGGIKSQEQKERSKMLREQYRLTHKKEANGRAVARRKTDIQYRLGHLLRGRLNKAIKRNTKTGSSVKDLGCSIAEFKMYIEGQFKDGMSWDNLGIKGWHIDHKIPLSFFDLTKREELLKAVHYSNLQPMWAQENLKKHTKIYA